MATVPLLIKVAPNQSAPIPSITINTTASIPATVNSYTQINLQNSVDDYTVTLPPAADGLLLVILNLNVVSDTTLVPPDGSALYCETSIGTHAQAAELELQANAVVLASSDGFNWFVLSNTGLVSAQGQVLAYITGLTSDAQAQLNLKAPLASPGLTGTPTVPTPSASDNTTKIASTAYVKTNLADYLPLVGGTLTGALIGTAVTASGTVTAQGNVVLGTSTSNTATVNSNISANSQTISPTQLGYVSGVTSAIQTQLNSKAPLASPALTGTPTVPTASSSDNSTQIASTAYVKSNVADYLPLAGGTLTGALTGTAITASGTVTANGDVVLGSDNSDTTTLNSNLSANSQTITPTELSYVAGVTSALQTQLNATAPLASPTFTGTPAAPTPSTGDNTTKVATTAYVQSNLSSYATLASPTLTGTPIAPTASTGTDSTQIASTAYVKANLASYAVLASPALTGTPTVPTASTGTNTTQAASTAYVQANLASYATLASPALTGTPTVPTASTGDSSTKAASTAYVQANLASYGTLASSSTYTGNNTFSNYQYFNEIAELVNSVTSVTTACSLSYTSCQGINYVQTPTANFSLALTNVPSPPSNCAVYTLTLMMAVKYYCNSITVNGTSRTMYFGGGTPTINASATYVLQQINIQYLNSATPVVTSSVQGLW